MVSRTPAVRLATRDNPGLRAKQPGFRATQANEVTATLRPNPVAEFSAEQLGGRPFPTTDAIPQYIISVSLPIETGERWYRETSLEYPRVLGTHQSAVDDLETAVGGSLGE